MCRSHHFAAALALAAAWAVPAYAQVWTTTTTTHGTSTSNTKTNSWQSPDGNRRKTHSVTQTKSKSRSNSVTVATPNRGYGPPPVAGGYGYDRLDGYWHVKAGGRGCSLALYRGNGGNGGGATTSGCADGDLADVGNWTASPDGGALTLTKMLVVPVATLQRTGARRFDGTLRSGHHITVWR